MKVTDIKYECVECGYIKTDSNADMRCPVCGGDIKGNCFGVSNILNYHDNQLGRTISSNYQRRKLLKKQGAHYAEDSPKNREIRKEAEYFLGKKGDRVLDVKAKKEFTETTQKHAHRDFRDRVRKGTENVEVSRTNIGN